METVIQPSAGMLDMLIAHHKLIVAPYSSPLKISLRSTFDIYIYIPSGKLPHNYGKSQFLIGKSSNVGSTIVKASPPIFLFL